MQTDPLSLSASQASRDAAARARRPSNGADPASTPAKGLFFWVFAFLVPCAGTATALLLFGHRSAPEADPTTRLETSETRGDDVVTRNAPPVFVLDPTLPEAPASLASAVAELSRQVAELQQRTGSKADDPERWNEMLTSQDPEERRQLLRRLRDKAKTDPHALATIKNLLNDSDGRIRRDAIDALQNLEDASLMPDMKALLTDGDPRVRGRAAVALADMAENATDPAVRAGAFRDLGALLGDADPGARRDAVRGMQDLGGADSVSGLVLALGDKNFEVQGEAIRALSEVGDPQALVALRQSYANGVGPNALDASIALKKMGDGSAFARESARLQGIAGGNGNPDDRRQAMRVLVDNAPPAEVRPLLEKALNDPSDRVRRDAARALNDLQTR